jgi:prepilin peptidase CpaA
VNSFAWWPTLILLLMACITDLRSRRIPNWLVLPFLVAGFVVSGCLHGRSGIGRSLAGVGLAILLCGLFYWLGGLGAGDLKLCAAIGAWIGPHQLFIAQVATGIVGGIWVLVWAIYAGFLAELFKGTGDLALGWVGLGRLQDPEMTLENPLRRKMPYAPAIAIGTLLSFFAV